jgi:hypothetical protein
VEISEERLFKEGFSRRAFQGGLFKEGFSRRLRSNRRRKGRRRKGRRRKGRRKGRRRKGGMHHRVYFRTGNIEKIRYLRTYATTKYGFSHIAEEGLYEAALHDQLELIQYIVGLNLNIGLETILYGACAGGHIRIVQFLHDLSRTIHPSIYDIVRCVYTSYPKIDHNVIIAYIQRLRTRDFSLEMYRGALASGSMELFTSITPYNPDWAVLGYYAGFSGNVDMINMYIANSMPVSWKQLLDGVCMGGHAHLIKYLMARGGVYTTEDWAIVLNHAPSLKTAAALESLGITIEWNLVDILSIAENRELTHKMLDNYKLSQKNAEQAIRIACKHGYVDIVARILDIYGMYFIIENILDYACHYADYPMMVMLLERGARPYAMRNAHLVELINLGVPLNTLESLSMQSATVLPAYRVKRECIHIVCSAHMIGNLADIVCAYDEFNLRADVFDTL